MGNLVADAQLAATKRQGVEIAIMNYGGIRSDLAVPDLTQPITYSQVAAVHPFKGTLQIASLTGAEILTILEQQWSEDGGFKPLQISKGFTYSWDASQPVGQRVVASSLQLNGKPLAMQEQYVVTASGFLMDGGDGFKGFAAGQGRKDSGVRELIALMDYLSENDELGHPAGQAEPQGRVTRLQ